MVSDKLFLNTHLTYSQYQFDVGQAQERRYVQNSQPLASTNALSYRSDIRDWTLKLDFNYVPSPRHYVRFGGSLSGTRFGPASRRSKTTRAA